MGNRTNLLKGRTQAGSAADYRERLRSGWSGDRRDAVQQLARMAQRGELAPDAFQRWLAPLLDDSDLGVALGAAVALVEQEPLTVIRKLHDLLREALDRPVDALVLTASIRVFLGAADEALSHSLREAAEAAARDANGGARGEPAAWILGELAAAGDGAVVRTLVMMLSDPRVGNRAAAAWALGRSGRPEAFATLRTILLDHGNHALLDKALRGLGDADNPDYVEQIIDSLRYDAPSAITERLRALPSRYRRRRIPLES